MTAEPQSFTKTAAWLPVSPELLQDGMDVYAAVSRQINEGIDRTLNPWKYPDRYQWPTWDLFPRLTRLTNWVRSLRPVRDDCGCDE